MTRTFVLLSPSLKWLQMLLLAVALAATAHQARAQMTGEFAGDLAIVNSALAATIAATGKDNAQASRVAMEELYRQWRMLRAKSFETQASNPLFLPEMEKSRPGCLQPANWSISVNGPRRATNCRWRKSCCRRYACGNRISRNRLPAGLRHGQP